MQTYEAERFVKTSSADLPGIVRLIARDDGEAHVDSEYLDWWYFKNPSNSFAFFHLDVNGEPEGLATTNNMCVNVEGTDKKVAMPQKVLTSTTVRGKGYFGKLYRHTESDNIANGVDCFLTFTNAMSTPIFLEKFGYKRGISPTVFIVPSILGLIERKQYEIPFQFDEYFLESCKSFGFKNYVKKDPTYFTWRYLKYDKQAFSILRVINETGGTIGYVVLKRRIILRLPVYVVMDVIAISSKNIDQILWAALHFSLKKFAFGIMFLENDLFASSSLLPLAFKKRNKLNFLVKGKTEEETTTLSKIHFNFFAGDLDFF
jgi:hypothetical protein